MSVVPYTAVAVVLVFNLMLFSKLSSEVSSLTAPTRSPTHAPTMEPSPRPTQQPTRRPTKAPTRHPAVSSHSSPTKQRESPQTQKSKESRQRQRKHRESAAARRGSSWRSHLFIAGIFFSMVSLYCSYKPLTSAGERSSLSEVALGPLSRRSSAGYDQL